MQMDLAEMFAKYAYKGKDRLNVIVKQGKTVVRPRFGRIPKKVNRETQVRDALYEREWKYGILKEVKTYHGRIDILSPDEIIEIKCYRNWKHGIGQLKAYQEDPRYKHYGLRLHLFDYPKNCDKESVEECCKNHQIRVTWE